LFPAADENKTGPHHIPPLACAFCSRAEERPERFLCVDTTQGAWLTPGLARGKPALRALFPAADQTQLGQTIFHRCDVHSAHALRSASKVSFALMTAHAAKFTRSALRASFPAAAQTKPYSTVVMLIPLTR